MLDRLSKVEEGVVSEEGHATWLAHADKRKD